MKPKPKRQQRSQRKRKQPLEFSKKLTIIDIIVYLILSIALLIILLLRPELGTFARDIFAYLTTAYVSLRLGYTAKAGVENYKKIAQTYQQITQSDSDSDCEPSDDDSLG